MDAVEASNLWATLPAELRDQIDEMIRAGRRIQAIADFRNRSGLTPKPRLAQAVSLVEHRETVLKAND